MMAGGMAVECPRIRREERGVYGYGHIVGEVESSSKAMASSSVAGLRIPS